MTESIVSRELARQAQMLHDVRSGMSRPQKELPPKYFYDTRGSELFEEITRLPEYYLTRVERSLLERLMPEWIAALAPRALIELGAGSAVKTRIILDAMLAARPDVAYVPVDVSADFLESVAESLQAEYPEFDVRPTVGDFTERLVLPDELPRPAVHALIGSTIGNFDDDEAQTILRRIRGAMGRHDSLLLGVDLQKDPAVIERAYNDAAGVTAEFNLNMLRVLNRELGANFPLDAFEHRAFYNTRAHRIEMHLDATRPMTVRIPGAGTYVLGPGESIRTEISCKYDRARVEKLCAAASMRIVEWATDDDGLYAIVLIGPV